MNDDSWFILPLAASPWPVQIVAILILSVLAVLVAWFLIILQNRSTGMRFRNYWEAMRDNPIAVAIYRVGIFWAFFGLIAILAKLNI